MKLVMESQKHIEAYQDLFDCLWSYGIILLQSEMDEIISLSEKAVEKYNEASGLAKMERIDSALVSQLIYTIEEQLDPLHPVRHSNSFLTLKKQTNG
jgi:hypothetical protein